MIYIKFYKKILFIFLFIVCTFASTLTLKADDSAIVNGANYVIVGGDAIGLDLNIGVIVTGKVESKMENNIKKGDTLIKVDNISINNVEDLKNVITKKTIGSKVIVEFIRNGVTMKTSVSISEIDGKNSIGLYVKDNVLGVGTLTYVVPGNLSFGSLGHSATTNSSNINGGKILKCYINGINKGVRGVPGEKKALLDSEEIGKINLNNDYGIFGVLESFNYDENDLMKVTNHQNVKLGKAVIRTVIEGYEVEEFDIEIIELKKQDNSDVKGIKFIVTDEELIEKTGGIIQGMSGSPIIQDNELVGAVSHVVIDNPTSGYGVYAEWMLNYSNI